MDSTVWRFAEDLLRDIDEIYTKEKNRTYSYEKRNQTTAAVYLMLSTALMQVMDNSEAVFFLNTHNATLEDFSKFEDGKISIASPWIYQEVMMTKFLRPNTFRMKEKSIINENGEYTEKYRNLIMLRSVDLSHMQKLPLSKFVGWVLSLINEQRKNRSLIIEVCASEADSCDTSIVLKRRMKAMEKIIFHN